MPVLFSAPPTTRLKFPADRSIEIDTGIRLDLGSLKNGSVRPFRQLKWIDSKSSMEAKIAGKIRRTGEKFLIEFGSSAK